MKTDLLIIGAGPFGMAMAAQASHDRIEHMVAGKAMEFWRANMPKGMFLRSACDWHLDPQNVHTIEAYLQTQNKTPETEKDDVNHRLWAEGRLKIEPWLQARLNDDRVKVWPQTEFESCSEDLEIKLTNGEKFKVDELVIATGYKVNIGRLPYLAAGNLLERLETRNGFPVLDDHFETSVPGLFITSMPATQDFGPFFGFTISVRTSARLICERLLD